MRRANATCAGGERIDKDDIGAPNGKRRQCIYYYSQGDVERRDLICCSCHVEVTSSGPCNKYEEWRHKEQCFLASSYIIACFLILLKQYLVQRDLLIITIEKQMI